MKAKILLLLCLLPWAATAVAVAEVHSVTVRPAMHSEPLASGQKPFAMGTCVAPSGDSLTVDRTSLRYNGQPVIPVMGEFHYSRYPAADWRTELLKMKAGGITVVATYVFWIHHEEREGIVRWEDELNLRRFVTTCGDVGLPVILRLGPWSHGECRNGGIPDWLATRGIKLRTNNAAYLVEVRRWLTEIYRQVEGLLWKDGGPIIGVQLENEYRGDGAHLMTLKSMAREIGFDVPLYTRTGWPKLGRPVPYGEILPLYGDYADGFWDRSIAEMPGDYGKSYIFRSFRSSTVIATEQLPAQSATDDPDDVAYPYFTCELGGGMVTSYARRIAIDPMDVFAMSIVRVGSGSNLPGYYMYHGGTNPDGLLATMNEVQSSPMTNYNEMPVKSYEFQAPLGEFGQIDLHYHLLRRLHLFLADFGGDLSQMPPTFPADTETDFRSDSLLRWAVRSDGTGGYIFVNNYHRLRTLPDRRDVQFAICRAQDTLTIPASPIDIPSGTAFFMPFGLDMSGAHLVYSTAAPIMRLSEGQETVYVFGVNTGIAPEFVFDAANVRELYSNVPSQKRGEQLCYRAVQPGLDAAIGLKVKGGGSVTIVLLDERNALRCWKGRLAGRDRMIISDAAVTCDGDRLRLTDNALLRTPVSLTASSATLNVHIFPVPQTMRCELPMTAITGAQASNVFAGYAVDCSSLISAADRTRRCPMTLLRAASDTLCPVATGAAGSPVQPSDSDFMHAAVWRIELPKDIDASRDVFLSIPYVGDAARLYSGDRLLTDNFYNGRPFCVGLRRYAPAVYDRELRLEVMPLRDGLPIYLPAWPEKIPPSGVAQVQDALLWEMHTVELTAIDESEKH